MLVSGHQGPGRALQLALQLALDEGDVLGPRVWRSAWPGGPLGCTDLGPPLGSLAFAANPAHWLGLPVTIAKGGRPPWAFSETHACFAENFSKQLSRKDPSLAKGLP